MTSATRFERPTPLGGAAGEKAPEDRRRIRYAVPGEFVALLRQPVHCYLTTRMPGGSPQTTLT